MTSIPDKNQDFFSHVFNIVRLIPEGRITNYGSIAKALGSAKSSRMVGWAMNASHRAFILPTVCSAVSIRLVARASLRGSPSGITAKMDGVARIDSRL